MTVSDVTWGDLCELSLLANRSLSNTIFLNISVLGHLYLQDMKTAPAVLLPQENKCKIQTAAI